MVTNQQLMDDVNLRYRNTFSTQQKLVWMNEEIREVYDILQIDDEPAYFTLAENVYFYPIPYWVDIDRIKVMTIQINDQDPPSFQELRFLRNDNDVPAWQGGLWCTIVDGQFYLNIPGGPVADRVVYIFHDSRPTQVTIANLGNECPVPIRYQEIVKLGLLERICAARKDVVMKNNFSAEKEQKILDMEWKMKMSEPEFVSPTDVNPKIRNRYRNGYVPGWYGW